MKTEMTKLQKQRLEKLCVFLDTLKPKNFNITEWVTSHDNDHPCKTVACAIGWCPKVFPRSKWKWSEVFNEVAFDGEDPTEGMVDFFGISAARGTYETRENPFYHQYYGKHKIKKVTPKVVARHLRKTYLNK